MPLDSAVSSRNAPLEALIVDDDPRTCELLAEFCRRRGMVVTTATDGRAAMTAIVREPARFSLVITDLNLPGVDGFEVLKAARACQPVLLRGDGDRLRDASTTAVRAVREGAYDYLPKPFALGQLEVILRRIHDRIALEQENRDLTRQIGRRDARRCRPGGSREPARRDRRASRRHRTPPPRPTRILDRRGRNPGRATRPENRPTLGHASQNPSHVRAALRSGYPSCDAPSGGSCRSGNRQRRRAT